MTEPISTDQRRMASEFQIFFENLDYSLNLRFMFESRRRSLIVTVEHESHGHRFSVRQVIRNRSGIPHVHSVAMRTLEYLDRLHRLVLNEPLGCMSS